MSSSIVSTTKLLENVLEGFYSRRLLLHAPLNQPANLAAPPAPASSQGSVESYTGGRNFDANVVMVLSVLLCALICSLGLNTIIRCALRCSSLAGNESGNNPTARLANTGLKRKAIKTFPIVNYSTDLKLPGLDSECIICLSEFTNGEKVRLLPKCNHGFHVRCIDKWLSSHSSCPKCRHCLIETCQKIVGCNQASSSQAPIPVPETFVRIAPLEPESMICNYRNTG